MDDDKLTGLKLAMSHPGCWVESNDGYFFAQDSMEEMIDWQNALTYAEPFADHKDGIVGEGTIGRFMGFEFIKDK